MPHDVYSLTFCYQIFASSIKQFVRVYKSLGIQWLKTDIKNPETSKASSTTTLKAGGESYNLSSCRLENA
jgi:hypothetical protein